MKTKYPRVWRWLRLDQYLYNLVAWGENLLKRARRKLRKAASKARPFLPHVEALEIRWLPTITGVILPEMIAVY